MLLPIFGDSIVKDIKNNYDDSEVDELYSLVNNMLTSFMGSKKAKPFLDKLAKKYNIKNRAK